MRISLLLTPCSDENLQLAAQIGATEIVATYPGLELSDLLATKARVESFGLKLSVIERYVPTLDFIHGTEHQQAQIEGFKTLVRNLGEAEIGVLCYSWMPDDDWQRTSLAVEDRGGALVTECDLRDPEAFRSVTGFDYRTETPTPADRLWENLALFLDEVIPVAEEAGVRLAMHPDDPPVEALHGQPRLFWTPEAFERLFALNDSPNNAMCFCQGSFASMAGEQDIPGLIEQFATRIAFAHFRDVVGAVPYFRETFQDLGKTDMAACMRAYLKAGIDCPIRPDHVPTLVGESNETPGYHRLGRLWAVGYMRGLIDAIESDRASLRIGTTQTGKQDDLARV